MILAIIMKTIMIAMFVLAIGFYAMTLRTLLQNPRSVQYQNANMAKNIPMK